MSDVAKPAAKKYDSFAEFYPFYLSEHSDRTCRRLHFAGSTLALLCVLAADRHAQSVVAARRARSCGYGFAWIGHFVFEKNQPASFKQPLYSFMGDWKMFWQIVDGEDRVLTAKTVGRATATRRCCRGTPNGKLLPAVLPRHGGQPHGIPAMTATPSRAVARLTIPSAPRA